MTKQKQLKCYLDALADIYEVTPKCLYTLGDTIDSYKIIFKDNCYEGKALWKYTAKERAYTNAIIDQRCKPLMEFKGLVERHGLKPVFSTNGNTVSLTLGDLIFEGQGPKENLANEIAQIKALKYLRSLPLPDTAGTCKNTMRPRKRTVAKCTESKQNMDTGETEQATTMSSNNLNIMDTGEPQAKCAVEDIELSVNQSEPIEIKTTGTESKQNMATGEIKQATSIASNNNNSSGIEDTGEGQIKHAVEDKELLVNQNGPIEQTESLKGLGDNMVRLRYAGNNATKEVLQEPIISRGESLWEEKITLVKSQVISFQTDPSATRENILRCRELQVRGLRQAPINTADISDPNIIVVVHKDNIDNTPVGIQKAARHIPPPEKTRVYSLEFRPQIRFPKELELTLEEKEGILNEAVHDLVQEFSSPQLLREAVLKPEDHKLLDILTERLAVRYSNLKTKKQTETPPIK